MAAHEESVYLLRGGVRDGQFTSVGHGVTRLLAMSDAPGMLDVYELSDSLAVHPETGAEVGVFVLVGQEPTGDEIPPELQHSPGHNPVPGSS